MDSYLVCTFLSFHLEIGLVYPAQEIYFGLTCFAKYIQNIVEKNFQLASRFCLNIGNQTGVNIVQNCIFRENKPVSAGKTIEIYEWCLNLTFHARKILTPTASVLLVNRKRQQKNFYFKKANPDFTGFNLHRRVFDW